jgi:hypothetical protein
VVAVKATTTRCVVLLLGGDTLRFVSLPFPSSRVKTQIHQVGRRRVGVISSLEASLWDEVVVVLEQCGGRGATGGGISVEAMWCRFWLVYLTFRVVP